ncbi:MAG: sodium-translocating pyrophosphatase [Phycisphaerae bacterium]|jgi:K(+)-stimulated pyrophosphate-energized sodium pump
MKNVARMGLLSLVVIAGLWGLTAGKALAAGETEILTSAGAEAPKHAGGSEADIKLPPLHEVSFRIAGLDVKGDHLMYAGLAVCVIGLLFGLRQYGQIKAMPVHASMGNVSDTIWETCKTYLLQQGKFLVVLWLVIGACVTYYFGYLERFIADGKTSSLALILASSVLGVLGSYSVAWFGIRINTRANSRAAFSALKGFPIGATTIPMKSGMSVGLLLVSVELFFMICILVFLPAGLIGPCFIGFAIGESLGASALRIGGGIFTKIADIGSDLMKIIFKLPEDDPKNPGVIADCTGDNAGDSVGPTADGFETYGVTGVALITFLALALGSTSIMGAELIVWIFVMRILMILTSLVSYYINEKMTVAKYSQSKRFDPEHPLTHLVWLTSLISIGVTFGASYLLLGGQAEHPKLWWVLSVIISCGTAAGALIPEFTKIFTSTKSKHVKEIMKSADQGGASLGILSGFVSGNFSAFWTGLLILGLMFIAFQLSGEVNKIIPEPLVAFGFAGPIFAFGLVAFGFLGMGPVTIAVDSFGPVSDNAQSVYELSQIESLPNIKDDIKRNFGFEPDFENGKYFLESNDGAGNTFKATAKPVLIGTAVVGATTMIFSIILLLGHTLAGGIDAVMKSLSLVQPEIAFGLLMGGATIYWFTGASTQAVVTGSFRAVVYIKEHMNLTSRAAEMKDSKEVVKICTQYAQKGLVNIFIVVFCLALGLAFMNSFFFIGYLIAIAFFGLFQAIFMANAGAGWDNAKKIVEVDLRQKGTELHAATVVCDTVGDPFKDTSSVAMNPVIKFTTLFGVLATQIAVTMNTPELTRTKLGIGAALFVVALIFVIRSFYGMRIPAEEGLKMKK